MYVSLELTGHRVGAPRRSLALRRVARGNGAAADPAMGFKQQDGSNRAVI
jgi:hypothetical protein